MAGGFFAKLQQGLSKTRENIAKGIDNVFNGFSNIDDDFYEELEETLIMGDIGIDATSSIIDNLRKQVKEKHISDPAECKKLLVENIREQMRTGDEAYDFEDKKTVIFVIGVNGVGKTTSVGKLAAIYKNKGKKVLIAAADTYRAAATEQLKEWADRAGTPIICGKEGGDPGSVIYDAAFAFKSRDCDILIVDTAGRLHNKKNLMDELAKMRRVIAREYPECYVETLIVLDGSTGQNALEQARQFSSVTEINGIILTKLDGTAKGGIAVAIQSELKVPVKYIGVGEKIDDLQKFDADAYVRALFYKEGAEGDAGESEEE